MTSGQAPTLGRYALSFGINFVGGGFLGSKFLARMPWWARVSSFGASSLAEQFLVDRHVSVVQTAFALIAGMTGIKLEKSIAPFEKVSYIAGQFMSAKITQCIDLLSIPTKKLWNKIWK